jgi:hypothetical protein
MSARTDLSGGYQADWYPYRDPPKAGALELYPNPLIKENAGQPNTYPT